jgi:hypothetical protein
MSSGLTREEIIAGNQAIGVLLSLIFVYFLLSAQYESYLVPLSILLSLPVVLLLVFVYLRIGKQYLLPGRFDHAYRVARQECHFDRRICHTKRRTEWI